MNFVFEKNSLKYELIGGKATALSKIGRAIDNIPDWFVVSFIGFDTKKKEIKKDAKAEIEEKLKEFNEDSYFAIRSSAASEDSNANSFAGQFDTFLYVKKSDVINKIKEVFLSGYSDRVMAYKKENNIDEETIPAVIVQKMINSEKAGVAFGVNPVNSNVKEIVVSAVFGLGSGLVDGIATADTYTLIENKNNEIKKEIAEKDFYHKLEGDEIKEKPVPEELKEKQVLEDDEIYQVRDLVKKASDFFGRYQDIEWAIEDGKVYLLQSRPITTLAQNKSENEKINVFDNSNIVESYGGITTPLTFSFIRNVYENVYIELCKIFNIKKEKIAMNSQMFKSLLALIDGRVYYNLYGWYGILTMFPGLGSNKKFMESMMGVKESLPDNLFPVPQETFKDKIGMMQAGYGLVKGYFDLRKMTKKFYERLNEALEDKDIDHMDLYELHDYYYLLESKLLHKWDAPLVNDFLAMIFYGKLKDECAKLFKEESNLIHNDLLTDEGGIISAEPAKRIKELASIAKDNQELIELLDNEDLLYIQKELPKYEEFNKKINEYLDKFSDRCLEELKLETETLKDNPRSLYHSISTFARRMQKGDIQEIDTVKARKEAEEKVKEALRFHPNKKRRFKFILKNARYTVKNRENLRFERTRLFGRVREIFLRIGYILTSMNVIEDKRDIFYLEVDEILFYIDGKSTTNNLKDLIAIRKAQYEKYKSEMPDERFYSYGAVNIGNDFKHERKEKEVIEGEESKEIITELKGIGASPGKVVGYARVIHNPANAKIKQGEILVAEFTDPGWIMLFPSSSGILVERGSLLSHSAIVSRELGIPAVVGITGLIDNVKTGDLVELDGTTGKVKILDKGGPGKGNLGTLRDIVQKSAKEFEHKALYESGTTFSNFLNNINALGTALLSLDMKGKRIGILAENSEKWETTFLSISCGVGTVIPLDKDLTKEELRNIVYSSDIQGLFYSESNEEKVAELEDVKLFSFEESYDTLIERGKTLLKDGDKSYIDAKIDEIETNFIFFTSGTSSKPKGVKLSHRNIVANIEASNSVLGLDSSDVALSILPEHHVLEGIICFLQSIKNGLKRIFAKDLESIAKTICEENVTFMGAVPALWEVIYEELEALDKEQLEKIKANYKLFFTAGAPANINLLNKYKTLGIKLVQYYGMTESASCISIVGKDEYRIGSSGKVLSNIDLKLSDKDQEILISGPVVFNGYTNNPTHLDEEGFFHTGDLGKIDNDGYLFIIGRNKNIIVLDNGQKVYPEEIEAKINEIENVKESIVFGKGNKINAKVVYEDEEDLDKIKQQIEKINKTMPEYKRLTNIEYTTKGLQKNSSQKVIRQEEAELEPELETKVKKILCEVLKCEDVNIEDNIVADLKADSLDSISIKLKLEKEFGIEIPREDSKELKEVQDIINYIARKQSK